MRQIQIQHTTYKYNIQVEIDGAKTCQIQIAQSVPIASPLTWNLVGDPGQSNDNSNGNNKLPKYKIQMQNTTTEHKIQNTK